MWCAFSLRTFFMRLPPICPVRSVTGVWCRTHTFINTTLHTFFFACFKGVCNRYTDSSCSLLYKTMLCRSKEASQWCHGVQKKIHSPGILCLMVLKTRIKKARSMESYTNRSMYAQIHTCQHLSSQKDLYIPGLNQTTFMCRYGRCGVHSVCVRFSCVYLLYVRCVL